MTGSYSQGGSTITQQVVKNALLTREKTISRKITEWMMAIKLDAQVDKDAILTIYLNESPYGGSIYGVEEASMSYFGKSASDVTLAEAAYLAAMPQSPTYYSPFGNHIDALKTRQQLVLRRMFDLNLINDSEYETALAEDVKFKKNSL
jgi:membrane peptidoglycan carboxypeptidase